MKRNKYSSRNKAARAPIVGFGITGFIGLILVIIWGFGSSIDNLGKQFNGNSTISTSSSISQNTSNNESNYQYLPDTNISNEIFHSISDQVKLGNSNQYDSGSYVINNNVPSIEITTKRPYAQNQIDSKKRPTIADAFLTKQTRQYKSRQATNNGSNGYKPQGYHQLSNLPKPYNYAYNRGHLLGYALVGNLKKYDASEHNKKNIVTQTMWSNQANAENNKGQNYYEGLVRKALDQNKQVRYRVQALYKDDELIPRAIWLQALSTDGTLKINVVIPNIQNNITIDYNTGYATPIN